MKKTYCATMKKRNRLLGAACALALLVLPQFARAQTAQTPIIDSTGGVTGVESSVGATTGFQFTVISGSVPIAGLGLFDVGSVALTESHAVGLWDANGTLIASTTIDNTATPVPSSSPLGRWLEKDITPISLSAGTYVLGAFYPPLSPDYVYYQTVPSPIVGVTFGTSVYTVGSGLLFPTTLYPIDNAGVFGPMAFVDPLSLTPLSLAFPGQTVGTTSTPKVVTATNVSPNTITISNIATTGDFAPPSNTCQSPLAPGDRCTIKVTFTPTQPNKRTGGLIVTDDAPGSPQTIPLTGTGLGSGAKLTPKTLNFGTQPAGIASPPQTVTLTNTGNRTLNITGTPTTGPFSTQPGTCGSTLAAKANCAISIIFDPSTKGPQTGTLSVTDDAPGSPQMVNLKGTGTLVELFPASLSFGSETVGTTSAPQSVTLTNTGSTALKVTIGIGGANPGDFNQTNNCHAKVNAGASCTINVTFTPTAQGSRSGTVSVSDSGGGSPQTVALTGTGT